MLPQFNEKPLDQFPVREDSFYIIPFIFIDLFMVEWKNGGIQFFRMLFYSRRKRSRNVEIVIHDCSVSYQASTERGFFVYQFFSICSPRYDPWDTTVERFR